MTALHVRLTLAFAVLLALVGFGLLALLSLTSDRYADEVRQRLDSGLSMYVVRELASPDGRRVFSVAPVQERGQLDGYLYVVLGGQPERSIAQRVWSSYALRAAALALGLMILATLIAAGGLFAVLTRRLRSLDRSMETWSRTLPAGAFPPRASAGGDEISALTARFADMSRAI